MDPIKFYNLHNNNKIQLDKLTIIVEELENYKEQNGLIDFPDMLDKFITSGEAPKLRVMFVDEAQDLSLVQWKLVKKIEEKAQYPDAACSVSHGCKSCVDRPLKRCYLFRSACRRVPWVPNKSHSFGPCGIYEL